jgi:Flp pilus assembly protein TadG
MRKLRRGSGQRGSTMVEAALIFLPLMAFVCAVIDGSMVMFVKNSVRHAVHEGVRYGITAQIEPGLCQENSIKTIVQRNAMGLLDGSTGLSRIQVNYYDPNTFAASTNRPGNIVEVSVTQLPWSWIVPIWHISGPVNISAASSDILESAPNGIMPCR